MHCCGDFSDVDYLYGEVSENPEGSAARIAALFSASHQVSGSAELQGWARFSLNSCRVFTFSCGRDETLTLALSKQTWIVGKWLSYKEQQWAPPGTHFHQFVVPPVFEFRRDCTYGKLAAVKLPEDVQGLGMCEVTTDR